MKVLIIDDDPSIRRLAGAFLAGQGGMIVIEAATGADGIRMAQDEQPQVILLDACMTDLNGPETLAILKQAPETAAIPVIFLTGRTRPDDVAFLASLDVCGVLPKPFNPVLLAGQVRALLDDGLQGTAGGRR